MEGNCKFHILNCSAQTLVKNYENWWIHTNEPQYTQIKKYFYPNIKLFSHKNVWKKYQESLATNNDMTRASIMNRGLHWVCMLFSWELKPLDPYLLYADVEPFHLRIWMCGIRFQDIFETNTIKENLDQTLEFYEISNLRTNLLN